MTVTIEPLTPDDWNAVRAIYREGLATGLAAFMTDPPGWEAWDAGHLPVGRLVARTSDGAIAGWSALAPVPDT
jgi:L-amino acid N-acyltransferase YncA